MEKPGVQSDPLDVTLYLPMVENIARRLKSRFKPAAMEDLVSFGMLGLLEAARRYDPGQETPFEVFARLRIRGAMIDGVRAEGPASRRRWERVKKVQEAYERLFSKGQSGSDEEVCQELGVDRGTFIGWLEEFERFHPISLDHVIHTEDGESFRIADAIPDPEGVDPAQTVSRQAIRQLLAEAIASLPEREQYVLSLHYIEGLSFREVAAVLGVTPARVSQLHSKTLLRLRSRLAQHRADLME
ncbi:sigma-70 family RNA polymerase sigma factor [Kyrpidia spormannii]|uniref:RNA polymerase sigma factor n=1 Tax=Kyrpidia spormannii TaxID=2055160 RepID=A0A6F9E967_9BACL|nr:FliA/WhiG family RNA polymerase sigma factor [Kyrpidia spormannii]CAB3393390.1 RNA polymerase sigma factor [Kyrpidia spormannii]